MENKSRTKKEIHVTSNYGRFKRLNGNRPVKNGRVVKIMESIQKYGWLSNPILVNERFEIIDGQGRFEALQRLGLPVEYIVQNGIGLTECQGLNHYQKNWTLIDHVNSFAENKNDNYIYLKNILAKYKTLPNAVICSTAASKGLSYQLTSGSYGEIIESGELLLTTKERKRIDDALFYLSRFSDIIKYLGGRKDMFYSAIMFMYLLSVIDNERLYKVVKNAKYEMVSSGSVAGYIQQFEDIYNKSLAKKNRVDAMHEFKIA